MKRLFNENISPSCSYCVHGNNFIKQETVLCVKFGVVDAQNSCKKFKYDPLKRIPKTRKKTLEFNKNDFSI